jgi:CRP/FNR family cyclic AMP-dependent transcriptional regulator
MLALVRRVKAATAGDLSMEWARPFTSASLSAPAPNCSHRGADARDMLFIVPGRFRLVEMNIELGLGETVGELGLFSPGGTRTASVECAESGQVLRISYDQFRQLYYQNPQSGFYILQLIARRLFDNIGRLEKQLAERDREIARLSATFARQFGTAPALGVRGTLLRGLHRTPRMRVR